MAYGKRRNKGKQGGRPSTPVRSGGGHSSNNSVDNTATLPPLSTSSSSVAAAAAANASGAASASSAAGTTKNSAAAAASSSSVHRSGSSHAVTAADASATTTTTVSTKDLILTSEKRRGVYECDYCHSDISQLPRIRCAVCPDFDLCLDCFANTDHTAAIARIRAANHAHEAVQLEEQAALAAANSGGSLVTGPAPIVPTSLGGGPAGMSSSSSIMGMIGGSGVSTAAINHDVNTHGYRVCDSTRFPLFPTVRNVVERTSSGGGGSSIRQREASATSGVDDSSVATSTKRSKSKDKEYEQGDGEFDASSVGKESSVEEDFKDGGGSQTSTSIAAAAASTINNSTSNFIVTEDPRNLWTVEEDLRLIEGIRSHGLGNWSEISDAVSGQGSNGKTPKRCMERYLDDFLGKYGKILPSYTVQVLDESANNNKDDDYNDGDAPDSTTIADEASISNVRSSKRRLLRSPSGASTTNQSALLNRKKFRVVPTDSVSLAGGGAADDVWPYPYLPPTGVQMGQDVQRDHAYKAEQTFVKLVSQCEAKEQSDKIRRHWEKTKLGKPGGPTVLPMRPEDLGTLPGAELVGFMPRRGDFDVEWDNDAEQAVADMEFLPGEPQSDKELKLKVLAIYNARLDEREKRKKFVLSRKLYDYRSIQMEEAKLPQDERDLVHRMRLFERFQTPQEHKQFIADLLKAKRIRKEIAKLQTYRRLGIRTLAEAELYQLEKARRSFHKTALHQKEAEAAKSAEAAGGAGHQAEAMAGDNDTTSSSLWKKYRTSDRKVRKSINRGTTPAPGSSSRLNPEAAAAAETGKTSIDAKMVAAAVRGITSSSATALAIATRDKSKKDSVAKSPSSMDVYENDGSGAAKSSLPMNRSSHPSFFDEDPLLNMPGFHLLTVKEADLCRKLSLTPSEYQEIKTALIQESLVQGLLDKETPSSSKRSIVKIDVQRRGDILDFMVRAGWVSSKVLQSGNSSFQSKALPESATSTTLKSLQNNAMDIDD